MKAKVFVGPPESGKSRVAEIIKSVIGEDRSVTLYRNFQRNRFKYYDVSNDTELIIIDDVEDDFDFERLFNSVSNDGFKVTVDRPCVDSFEVTVPNLIIITESISKELADSASFKARFDVIEFPLTK